MATKKKAKTEQDIAKDNLRQYFASIVLGEMNYGAYNAQLKKIMTENKDYTYDGIRYTLWYIKEHQGMTITSIGIVPYYYTEAKRYYQWLQKVKKEVADYNMHSEVKVIARQEKEEDVFV